jgi:PAS domain S-box-containing protein
LRAADMPRKANILAVDDKRANLVALDGLLYADYNVIFAQSGEEAIEILQNRRDIDLILMDVQMPGMDGFETASRIKQLDAHRDVAIIFVTAIFTDNPWIKKGYEVGGIDYFTKPFDPDILKLKVAVYSSFRLKADFLRERELHLRESEELLRVGRKLSSVLESLPVGVLIADSDGRICQITEEVSRILNTDSTDGDSYGELLGWWDTAGKGLKDHEGPLERALKRGQSTHNERLQIRRFNGAPKAIVASASPLRGRDGQIVGAVILIQDLTETKQIGEDLERRVTNLITLGVELEQTAAK